MLFAICSCDPKWAERESNVEGTTKTGLSIRKIGVEIEFKPNVLEIFRDTQKSGVKTKLIMGGAQHLKIFDNYIQSVLSLSQRKTFRKLKGDRWKRVRRKWEKRKSSTNERDVKEARSMDGPMDGDGKVKKKLGSSCGELKTVRNRAMMTMNPPKKCTDPQIRFRQCERTCCPEVATTTIQSK